MLGTTISLPFFLALILFAHPAMAAGKLPFDIGWQDSVAMVEAMLKKQTTNVHFVKDAPSERTIIESRKFYDDHPFTVRCVFYRNKLKDIVIYAVTAGFKDNLRRAGDLAKKIFLAKVKKYPKCSLLNKRTVEGGQKYFFRSEHALVDLSWGRIKKTKTGIVLVVWRRPDTLDNPFRDFGIYSAQLDKKSINTLFSEAQ